MELVQQKQNQPSWSARIALWRRLAEKARQIAGSGMSPQVESELLRAAADYDQMAQQETILTLSNMQPEDV
jgi:fructose-bisphosphate aldolase class 1